MEEAGIVLEGVITFYNSTQAMRAEKILKAAGIACLAIPGPREISPNCGVALAHDYARRDEAIALLDKAGSGYEAARRYPEARKIAGWL